VPGALQNGIAPIATSKFGEQKISYVDRSIGVSIAAGTTANVTSLNVPAGTWDISGFVAWYNNVWDSFYFLTLAGLEITKTSATLTNDGKIVPCGQNASAGTSGSWYSFSFDCGSYVPIVRTTIAQGSSETWFLVCGAVAMGAPIGPGGEPQWQSIAAYGYLMANRVC
jgi:hypothetical protein